MGLSLLLGVCARIVITDDPATGSGVNEKV